MRLAARDANTAPEALERLAASTNEYVLGDVAGNPKLSEATLRKLANHGGYLVEWGLAHNRSAPRDILSRLAGSPNDYTRGYVAANPNAPAEVLAALSKDVVKHVRVSVAQNPLDLPHDLRQTVKTQISLNGELSHGIVSQAVHEGI
jgi:hypothetical protein